MSRSANQRQQQKLQMQQQQLLAQQMADNDAAAAAAEMFDLFCLATTMRQILGLHRQMCDVVGMRPAPLNEFYPKLKTKVRSWKAQALWKKFDARASHRAYAKGNACTGTRVLVIGAGPCGLRTAIEAQLLGAKVVVLEKRDRISRNNVLHLWPFVITDLRNLGAKKFYGKFCAGSIDHISIRQLQCILLKVALLLGVEIHEGVSFESTIEPSGDGCGWRASITPADHAVSHYEFDVLIGADGKRNTLEAFKRKEFRGKLAIAITANFINKKTEAEAKAEEISGVAFIFNQSFFKELYHTTGIDLENIVYYKDETHYFVMTAKKHSLIDKGVIIQDFADPAELLASVNVNTEKLLDYAREAAEFSTKYQMPNLEFAVNHYGKPDVAMFDFTSMFAAESSCRAIVRKGFRLLQCLVGDSLLEPFWPTGSGCARGFLSSMDAAYAIKLWSNTANSTLGVMAQRESIYRLLGQTTPENLQRDIGGYTVDPATRYPNLNRTSVNVWQVKHLIDTDDKAVLEQTFMDTNALQVSQVDTPVRRKRRSGDTMPLSTVLLRWICAQLHTYEFTKELKEVSDVFANGKVLCALINRYRPDLVDFNAIKDLSPVEQNDLAFKILEKELHIPRIMTAKDSLQLSNIESKQWLNYLEQICEVFRGEIPHVKHPKIDFSDLREKYKNYGRHAQPDFSKLLQLSTKNKSKSPIEDAVDQVPQTVQRRSVLDEEKLKRQRRYEQQLANNAQGAAQTDTPRRAKKRRSADKAANIDRERSDIPSALPRNVDEQFSDRIKNMEQRITSRNAHGSDKKPKDLMRAIGKIDSTDWNVREIEKKIEQSKKTEVHGPKGREKVPKWSREQFQARQNKMAKPTRQDSAEEKFKEIDQTIKNLDKQLKEGNVLEVGKVASIAGQFVKRDDTSEEKNTPTVVPKSSSKVALAFKKQAASEKCHFCKQTVYLMEKLQCENLVMHRGCLKCNHCHTNLRLGAYAFDRDDPSGRFYCTQHFRLPAKAIRPVVRKPGQRKLTQQQQQVETPAAASTAKTPVPPYVNSESGDEPKTPDKRGQMDNVAKLDLLERGQTPERIEFENTDAMSDGEPSEEHIIDEHEWSGRNFLPESNNDSESDLSSSDESDTDSDSDMFEEANDSPLGAQTLQLASEWIGKQNNYSDSDDSDDFYDSSEGMPDDGKDDTEGEEFKKARELRREEVRLPPLPPNLPTDTETEALTTSENKDTATIGKEVKGTEIQELEVKQKSVETKAELDKQEEVPININDRTESLNKRKDSSLSNASDISFKSTSSLANGSETSLPQRTTKTDIEKLEQRNDQKISADIDAISEKLYRLNKAVKMNKDLETIAKENLIRSDILKKLSMKEKWLADDNTQAASINPSKPKSKFEEKVENFLKPISKFVEGFTPKSPLGNKLQYDLQSISKLNDDLQPKSKFNDDLQPKSKFNDELPTKPKFNADLQPKSKFNDQIVDSFKPKSKFNDTSISANSKPIESLLPKSKFNDQLESQRDPSQNANVVDLLKDLKNKENLPQSTQTPASPLVKSKTATAAVTVQEPTTSKKPASRSNSFKNPSSSSSPLLKAKTDIKLVKKDDDKMEIENILDIVKKIDISKSDNQNQDKSKDMGHLLYKVESKFSPKPNKKMVDKLKEIEAKSFSGTLDSIKSQMETPTVHTAPSLALSVNLSKYFPEQKQEKNSSNMVNKNQKNLNEVDLTKYFPTSPAPQRRSSVVTVADKLKKSQTEKSIAVKPKSPSNERSVSTTKNPPKRQASLGSANYSLKDNQLDGAIDIVKKKPVSKVVTTTVVANNTGKKGNVRIIKKIVRKVTKPNNKSGNTLQKKSSLLTRNEDDRLLDEILESSNEAQRSPSLEYKQLFQEEKSPSEDISDKIEQILEDTGIDLGIPKKSSKQNDKQKKLLKAKSLGEEELQRRSSVMMEEEGNRPSGVQNLLKRFESMSSVPSSSNSEHAFKLRRMESTTSNLNKSKESLISRESDNLSDLEKTMEYLKSEWRTEATNFLQKKRTDFQNTKKQAKEEEEEAKKFYDLPIQYKESKFAKFFGLKQKSPEKRKSPLKKKRSPEKKKSPEKKATQPAKSNSKPIIYTSLEELALIKANKQSPQKHTADLETKPKEPKHLQTAESTAKDLETKSKEEFKDSAKVSQQSPLQTKENSPTALETKPKEENKLSEELKQETEFEIKQEFKENSKNPDSNSSEDSNNVKRPLVEDIKNLPKRGCDKSLSNSRRGSQTSLQSRRLSQTSLSDKLEMAAQDLQKHLNNDLPKPIITTTDTCDEDSLCTSISKSPSVQPITVQMRGSSEDESIEKLFSQFSDEMLVNVEFDSNDELVSITQRSAINKEEQQKDIEDQDLIDREDSWEKDDEKSVIIDLQPSLERDFEQILKSSGENLERGDFQEHYELLDNQQTTMEREYEQILESNSQIYGDNARNVKNTLKNPQKLKVPSKTFSSVNNFPTRPQRRQKSLSSSSDSTTNPLAPQRIKKKLSKLSPTNMAPSIQDLLLNVKRNQDVEELPPNTTNPLKFPRIIDEDDILLDESQAFYKYLLQDQKLNENSSISNQENIQGSESSSQQPVIIINDGFQLNKSPENITEFTKVLRPITPPTRNDSLEEDNTDNTSKSSLTSSKKPLSSNLKESSVDKLPSKSNTRETSLEWNMEMMPNSPMPARRKISTATNTPTTNSLKLGSIESLNKLKKMEMNASQEKLTEQVTKEKTKEETKRDIPLENPVAAKENSTEKKAAEDNLPKEKELSTDKLSLNSVNDNEISPKLKEKSPTSSIKLLNNIDLNTETSEKRLIEEFELERRHALIQRDKQYQVMEKPPKLKQSSSKDSNSSTSKKSTPLATPSKQSPRDSRRSSMLSSVTNRGGSPPMTKPLEIPETAQTSEQTSRRSSFAFIELLGDKAVIAPMPKKLELPKIPEPEPEKPDNINEAAFNEDTKKRPWPKLQEEVEDEDDEKSEESKKFASEAIEYANIPLNSGPKREWPDGKTVFNNKSNNFRNPRFYKPRSETPETNYAHTDMILEKEKPSSKSTTDLRKLQSPYNSNYSLATTSAQTALTHSSNAIDLSSRNPTKADLLYGTTTPQRHLGHQKIPITTTGGDDAGTQMLLERSKRLHNRKRDFVNERVVERNPYMKDVINEERRNSGGNALLKYDTDGDDDITAYHHRPTRRYNTTTTNTSRFPSSRALGRTNLSYNNYDYVPSYTTGSSYSSRRLPITTSSVPTTSYHNFSTLTGSNNYHHYNPYTSSSALGHSAGRSSYLTSDYSRPSPSQLRDRTDLSKENCVQSESESTSPDEIEINSGTEISTDSEFDHDERKRETPKIFIDDTHLRKPTKVQVKSTILPPSMSHKYNNASINNAHQPAKGGTYLAKYQTQQPQQQQPLMPQFKPLVQVDPSLLQTNRTPLQNPRPGDYLLNKTASTEGIASKKSLELKKRYLLGEPANGNKIQKSGSTSVLDSRIRTFQSNISECQKLLNPGNEISPSMKTFLGCTKLGDKAANELMRSATNNILNDLKVEITIQKASSTASTDNEKENVFVNSKNELNKCMEYSEPVSDSLNKKSPSTPTNNKNIIETIDLVTPEKENILETSDSNKVVDLTRDSPVKSIGTTIESTVKPDLSLDVRQCIPDILGHIEKKDDSGKSKETTPTQEVNKYEEEVNLIDSNMEKMDAPEKLETLYDNEVADVQIEVPNIAWNTKSDNLTSTTNSSCSSSHSSSLEDIEHYILESTTSPETHNSGILGCSGGGNHQVPRLEIHDTSGTLMQIDSLMIIDGKYIGDPEDLKFMDIPEGVIIPELPAIKTFEIDEEEHELEVEPVTATPEPTETTVIEKEKEDIQDWEVKEQTEKDEEDLSPPPLPEKGPPLPEKGPPKIKPSNLKFDTKNENKIESLKNLPLIVDASSVEKTKAVKPRSLNLTNPQKTPDMNTPTTPKGNLLQTPTSPLVDMDKTPTGDLLSRGSDSETEPTGTAQILTETELSDWTADDCISENFVDMDFVHHSSNRSNLKGYRKEKRKSANNRIHLPTTNEVLQEVAKTAPVAEFEGILKSIDIDDIEFMDTGSDNSNTEPLSATNTAMLRNRGYMEFVDTTPKLMKIQINTITTQGSVGAANEAEVSSKELYKPIQCKRDEKLGIDYIEQGAYILQHHHHSDDNNKTPVNEVAQQSITGQSVIATTTTTTTSSLMTQSLTDSSTINELEDESTCNLSSQIQLTSVETCSKPSQQNTTTEESEALTVVTSPFDSSSPQQTQNSNNMKKETPPHTTEKEKTDSSTPSSSDRAPKSSQSSTCTNSATSSSKNTPPRQLSKEYIMTAAKSNDELSYEEYVRALQQKIVQISTTARGDSLETTRKQRRKSSKGEAPLIALTNPNQTVIESTTTPSNNIRIDKEEDTKIETSSNAPMASNLPLQLNKVPEIPTLSRKLEEITKERTKQKDLIHDLVMDKLQSKKQLNAEKRLHRSRQRSIITSSGTAGLASGGYSSGSSLSPTPKLAAANSTTDTNCTNHAHYHVSTAAKEPSSPLARQTTAQRLLLNTNKPIAPSTYVSAYGMEALSPTRANAYKQRPFSEHLEGDTLKAFEHRYKINKTPSFSITTTNRPHIAAGHQPLGSKSEFSTPIPPLRQKRSGDNTAVTTPTDTKDSNFSISTENLRTEARARARLKSNSELGLSPEEKIQLLRKRLQAEYNSNVKANIENEPQHPTPAASYERKHSMREQKMSNSKSVNDLAYLSQSHLQQQTVNSIDEAKKSDFTSDPNLLLSSSEQPTAKINKLMKSKSSSRRPKDPERRKSLIQSLSNFFHKGGPQQNKENKQQLKDATASPSDGSSGHAERTGTGGGSSSTSTSHTTVSSGLDGVLSRFRISPKSKEKSRDKDDYLFNMANSSCSPTRRLRTSSASMAMTAATSYDSHNSTDFLGRTHLTHTPYSHSQINNLNNNINNNSNNLRHRHHHHYQQHHQQPHHNNQHIPNATQTKKKSSSSSALAFSSSSPQLCVNKSQSMTNTNIAAAYDDQTPPPIPPLPLNYQRSDDESYATETRDQKKQRAISKAVRQAELKRLRIAQEIQREQEEIEVQLKELETRGVFIEKALRGEEQNYENPDASNNFGSNDEKLLKELLEIWRNITQLKKRDEELGIRQQELQLEHRHAQLKEELNLRLSCSKLDKSSADVAAEGAILNEMLEIVAKRAALRPSVSNHDLPGTSELLRVGELAASSTSKLQLTTRGQSNDNEESNI